MKTMKNTNEREKAPQIKENQALLHLSPQTVAKTYAQWMKGTDKKYKDKEIEADEYAFWQDVGTILNIAAKSLHK